MDFPALGPVSSIESYLEFWPASNTADVLLLFDALCTLPTGVSQVGLAFVITCVQACVCYASLQTLVGLNFIFYSFVIVSVRVHACARTCARARASVCAFMRVCTYMCMRVCVRVCAYLLCCGVK